MHIRDATDLDATAMLEIYAPYVTDTTVSFEVEVPTAEAFAGRIARSMATHAWLVAVDADAVLGYAYASAHRSRAAYRYAAEVSAYVAPNRQGGGIGRRLYEALFARLRARGFFRAYGGITMPNDASVAFHRALGFQPVGVYRRIGFKMGRWHDVSWWGLDLLDGDPDPRGPR